MNNTLRLALLYLGDYLRNIVLLNPGWTLPGLTALHFSYLSSLHFGYLISLDFGYLFSLDFGCLHILHFGYLSVFILFKVLISHFAISVDYLNGLVDTSVFILVSMTLLDSLLFVIPLVGLVLPSFAIFPFVDLMNASLFVVAFRSLVGFVFFLPKSFLVQFSSGSIVLSMYVIGLGYNWF